MRKFFLLMLLYSSIINIGNSNAEIAESRKSTLFDELPQESLIRNLASKDKSELDFFTKYRLLLIKDILFCAQHAKVQEKNKAIRNYCETCLSNDYFISLEIKKLLRDQEPEVITHELEIFLRTIERLKKNSYILKKG